METNLWTRTQRPQGLMVSEQLRTTDVTSTFTPSFGWAAPLALGTCFLSTGSYPTRSE
ncbi:hypothetical protein [Spirosoma sp. KCTC 42546]|uniref:hypothetical protein n=1 Tax=Spirosoma sp. KCTC 42546 TaxID=2520506 RepID=UPI00143D49E8|nr:hypothetical protein [Spirosoma sp. KCTC 42546]